MGNETSSKIEQIMDHWSGALVFRRGLVEV